MPKKRSTGKTRSRKPKPRQKQKQKQKQVQKVSVSVSGGGSGSGGFIPIPQAPSFDYAALASLIRPAATVDMPIAVQARPNRPAPPIPVGSSIESRFASEPMSQSFSASSAKAASKPFIATPSSSDFPSGILGRYQIPPIDVREMSREKRAVFMREEFNPEQEFIINKPKAKRQSVPSESEEESNVSFRRSAKRESSSSKDTFPLYGAFSKQDL